MKALKAALLATSAVALAACTTPSLWMPPDELIHPFAGATAVHTAPWADLPAMCAAAGGCPQ